MWPLTERKKMNVHVLAMIIATVITVVAFVITGDEPTLLVSTGSWLAFYLMVEASSYMIRNPLGVQK